MYGANLKFLFQGQVLFFGGKIFSWGQLCGWELLKPYYGGILDE